MQWLVYMILSFLQLPTSSSQAGDDMEDEDLEDLDGEGLNENDMDCEDMDGKDIVERTGMART
jgi:hypothetical protein